MFFFFFIFFSKYFLNSYCVFFVFPARLAVRYRTLACGAQRQGRGRYHSCDDVTERADPVVAALGGHRAAHGVDADLHQRPRSV